MIVFAHGSRIREANDAVRRVAGQVAERCAVGLWEAAFLELAEPSLESAVRTLADRGARKILVTPYFLMMGVHLQRDLPRILAAISEQHPGIALTASPPLDGHPALIDILADRVGQEIGS